MVGVATNTSSGNTDASTVNSTRTLGVHQAMRARFILYSAHTNTCVFMTIATAARRRTRQAVSRRTKNARPIAPPATLSALGLERATASKLAHEELIEQDRPSVVILINNCSKHALRSYGIIFFSGRPFVLFDLVSSARGGRPPPAGRSWPAGSSRPAVHATQSSLS